jgi:hypothetical protein
VSQHMAGVRTSGFRKTTSPPQLACLHFPSLTSTSTTSELLRTLTSLPQLPHRNRLLASAPTSSDPSIAYPSFTSASTSSSITAQTVDPSANQLSIPVRPYSSWYTKMAAPAQTGSKSSKKKAAQLIERSDSPAPSVGSGVPDKGDGSESPYVKELQK